MKLKILAVATTVAALVATSAMAQPQSQPAEQAGAGTMKMTKAQKLQVRHPRESNAAIVPGGGGAVTTAGVVATAPFTPFRGDSYAYVRDTSTMPNRGYIADANGPTCLPGQLTTINGQRMMCQ